jgi:hypothetical protein
MTGTILDIAWPPHVAAAVACLVPALILLGLVLAPPQRRNRR